MAAPAHSLPDAKLLATFGTVLPLCCDAVHGAGAANRRGCAALGAFIMRGAGCTINAPFSGMNAHPPPVLHIELSYASL